MSTTARAALVEANGTVVDVIVVDLSAAWEPPDGQTAIQLPDDSNVGPGWTHDGSNFNPPAAEPAGPALPTTPDLQAQLDDLADAVAALMTA